MFTKSIINHHKSIIQHKDQTKSIVSSACKQHQKVANMTRYLLLLAFSVLPATAFLPQHVVSNNGHLLPTTTTTTTTTSNKAFRLPIPLLSSSSAEDVSTVQILMSDTGGAYMRARVRAGWCLPYFGQTGRSVLLFFCCCLLMPSLTLSLRYDYS